MPVQQTDLRTEIPSVRLVLVLLLAGDSASYAPRNSIFWVLIGYCPFFRIGPQGYPPPIPCLQSDWHLSPHIYAIGIGQAPVIDQHESLMRLFVCFKLQNGDSLQMPVEDSGTSVSIAYPPSYIFPSLPSIGVSFSFFLLSHSHTYKRLS